MFQLIYASTAACPLGSDDLHELVENARKRNDRLGITSILVHRNGSFLQVLEGDNEETVRQLYETICSDERHMWIILLKASSLDERDFPEDPLTFRDCSMVGVCQYPGVAEILDEAAPPA